MKLRGDHTARNRLCTRLTAGLMAATENQFHRGWVVYVTAFILPHKLDISWRISGPFIYFSDQPDRLIQPLQACAVSLYTAVILLYAAAVWGEIKVKK